MDSYHLITSEYENDGLRHSQEMMNFVFPLREISVSLEFLLLCYRQDARRTKNEEYHHPVPVFNRLFLFRNAGGSILIDGVRHEFIPGRIYLLVQDHPFETVYYNGADIFGAHFLLTDHTRRPLFRNTPGLIELKSPESKILRRAWNSQNPIAAGSGIIHVLSQEIQEQVRHLEPEYRTALKYQPVFEYLSCTPPGLFRVGEMAELMNMTQTAFSKSFTRSVGIPPKEYAESLYLDRAKRLLLVSSQSVAAIAKELGHSSPQYFYELFSRLAGYSPGEFRRRNRGGISYFS